MKTSNLLVLCLACVISYSSALAAEPAINSSAELIYKNNCSVCHGDRGDGRSRASNGLVPPPRNFTEAGDLTREYMIHTVTNGKPGTAMTSWKTRFSQQEIASVVDYVRTKFMQETIQSHFAPARLAYGHYCKSCHGELGQGVAADGLTIAPRSFSALKGNLTRDRMISAVANGIPGTLMGSFTDKMSMNQIRLLVDYIREILMANDTSGTSTPASGTSSAGAPVDMSLPMPKGLIGDARLGEKFFMGNCATCHGTLGDGQGPRAYFMTSKPRNFLEDFSRTTLNRPAIFSAATYGRPGTEMPAWGQVLSEQEIANVAEFVFRAFIQAKTGTYPSVK